MLEHYSIRGQVLTMAVLFTSNGVRLMDPHEGPPMSPSRTARQGDSRRQEAYQDTTTGSKRICWHSRSPFV